MSEPAINQQTIVTETIVGLLVAGIIAGLGYVTTKLLDSPEVHLPTWLACVIVLALIAPGWIVWRRSKVGYTRRLAAQAGELTRHVEVFSEALDAFSSVRKRIDASTLELERCELIQHSSGDAQPLVQALIRAKVNVKLFVQDPATAAILCPTLVPGINQRLARYPGEIPRSYPGRFIVYRYKSPASLNAVRLTKKDGASLLLLSWYSFGGGGPQSTLQDLEIQGTKHNPCFLIESTHPQFATANDFFDRILRSYEAQEPHPMVLPALSQV